MLFFYGFLNKIFRLHSKQQISAHFVILSVANIMSEIEESQYQTNK